MKSEFHLYRQKKAIPAIRFALVSLAASLLFVGCTKPAPVASSAESSPAAAKYSLQALHKTSSLGSVCSITVTDADESNLQSLATISTDAANDAALSNFPGTTVVSTELDNENGCLVYGVNLSNGFDVKIDAGNGTFLYADSGNDTESGDSGTDTEFEN